MINKVDGDGPNGYILNVLIVDDEINLARKIYGQFFKKTKYPYLELSFSGDGRDALRCIERLDYDLIITDIRMPEMDGFTLLKTLQEEGSKIPVVILSAYGMEEYRRRAKLLGAVHFLEKPVSFADLLFAIHKYSKRVEQWEWE